MFSVLVEEWTLVQFIYEMEVELGKVSLYSLPNYNNEIIDSGLFELMSCLLCSLIHVFELIIVYYL